MTEQEFFNSIDTWIAAPKEKWTHVTLLAYFCHKYEKKNNVRFRLVRARRGPTMGKEAADFAKLFRTLAPDDYKEMPKEQKDKSRLKTNMKIFNYINWIFDYKFRRGQQSVNGTRLFLVPALIVEFERMYAGYLSKQINDTKFSKLVSWCKEEVVDIFDSHQLEREEDIRMIQRYADMYSLPPDSLERRVLEKAKEFDLL